MSNRRTIELIERNIELLQTLMTWEKEHKPTHYDRTSFRRVNEILIRDIADEIINLKYSNKETDTDVTVIPF